MGARWRLWPGDLKRDSRWSGVAAAMVAVAVCTALIYPLRTEVPVESLGVLYVVVVVAVAVRWGALAGVLTTFVSAQVFNFFHPSAAAVLGPERAE